MTFKTGPETVVPDTVAAIDTAQHGMPYIERPDLIDGIQTTVFRPSPEVTPSDSLTVMVGGIPRTLQERRDIPVIPEFFGHLATTLATADTPSTGLYFNWPGQGNSAGNALTTTIASRTKLLTTMVRRAQDEYGTEKINMVGCCVGAYSVLHAFEYFDDSELQSSVLLSPPAFSPTAYNAPYFGHEFRAEVRRTWDFDTSPAWQMMSRVNHRAFLAYFVNGDPPIPAEIQDRYMAAAAQNPHFTTAQMGSEDHDFRYIVHTHGAETADVEAAQKTADRVADFLLTPENP